MIVTTQNGGEYTISPETFAEETRARQQGADAKTAGIAFHDNPYRTGAVSLGDWLYSAWEYGYIHPAERWPSAKKESKMSPDHWYAYECHPCGIVSEHRHPGPHVERPLPVCPGCGAPQHLGGWWEADPMGYGSTSDTAGRLERPELARAMAEKAMGEAHNATTIALASLVLALLPPAAPNQETT